MHIFVKKTLLNLTEFKGEDPPSFCGHDVQTGKDKVCCKSGQTSRKTEILEKKFG